MRGIWKKMRSKEYRNSYVGAHLSNTVASQISLLREANGWTQKELADKSGMRQSRISALEDPNYENIEIGTLRRLASAFDVALTVRFVPFSELVEWTANLDPGKLTPASFHDDHLSGVSSHLIKIHPDLQIIESKIASEGVSQKFMTSDAEKGMLFFEDAPDAYVYTRQ
jgi:transcriptional regulator with XRE-family HTH domain